MPTVIFNIESEFSVLPKVFPTHQRFDLLSPGTKLSKSPSSRAAIKKFKFRVPMLIFVLTRKLLLFLIILVLEQTIISKYSEVQILQSSASRHHFRPLMRFFYHSRRELRYYMSSMTPNLYPYNLIMFYFTYFI